MTENQQDPELLDDPEEGIGEVVDLKAVENAPFNSKQFELPDDYEYEGDDA